MKMSPTVTFEKADHALDLMNRLYEMRMEKRHCDFVIKVGSERIPAHRNVLSAMSDYFDRMLFHDTIENSSGMVDMKNVDPDCVRICVDFIYGKKVEVSEEKYEDLMHVANLMQLNKLAKMVEDIICHNLNAKSFFAARRIADMYGCDTIQQECEQFANENFQSISMEDEFGDLDKSYVTEIIKSKIVKKTEAQKLDAALRWLKYDVKSRRQNLVYFLKRIDLSFVSIKKRQQLLDSDPLIKENLTCVTILSFSIEETLRKQEKDEKAIVIFDEISGHLQQFKPRSNSWRKMHRMNEVMIEDGAFTALVHGDYIYVFMRYEEVFRLKYADNSAKWEKMVNTKEDHGFRPPVVAVGRFLYAIAGHDNAFMKSVERFNPKTNKWTQLEDKPQAMKGFTPLVVRRWIYCFGGRVEYPEHSNVQRFDPSTVHQNGKK